MSKTAVEKTILEDIEYCEGTGELFWTKSGKGRKVYKNIGTTSKGGYLQATICGVQLKVHHIVWFINTGKWPTEIDHIDKNTSNNKFENLREGKSVNSHNRDIRVGASGLVGAHKSGKIGKPWKSSIKVDGCFEHLGYFKTKEEASEAYLKRKKEILDVR